MKVPIPQPQHKKAIEDTPRFALLLLRRTPPIFQPKVEALKELHDTLSCHPYTVDLLNMYPYLRHQDTSHRYPSLLVKTKYDKGGSFWTQRLFIFRKTLSANLTRSSAVKNPDMKKIQALSEVIHTIVLPILNIFTDQNVGSAAIYGYLFNGSIC